MQNCVIVCSGLLYLSRSSSRIVCIGQGKPQGHYALGQRSPWGYTTALIFMEMKGLILTFSFLSLPDSYNTLHLPLESGTPLFVLWDLKDTMYQLIKTLCLQNFHFYLGHMWPWGERGTGLHLTLMKVKSLLTHVCCHEILSEVTIAFASSTILYEYVGHFHISYLKLRLKVAYIKKKAVQV